MELCYFADEIDKADFDASVRLGAEAGATGIELRGGIWGKRVQEIDDEDLKRVRDVLAKYDMAVMSVGSPVGKCAHDSEREKAEHQRVFDRMIGTRPRLGHNGHPRLFPVESQSKTRG